MTTLISIMAHGKAEDTFKRHLPYWQAHAKTADLLFWSPANDSLRVEGYPCIEVASAQHSGTQAIVRFRTIIEHMAGLGKYERFVFMEYDSIILGPLPRLDGHFAGNIFTDRQARAGGWLGNSFVHPPFMCDDNAVLAIATQFQRMPLDVEKGFWDRALGLALEESRLTTQSWITTGYGYSSNTIWPQQHEQLMESILKGAHAIHGIKTPECLKVIEDAWKTRHKIDELEAEGYKVGR